MSRFAISCALLSLAASLAPGVEAPAARSLAGQLKDTNAWKSLGRHGCLVIRSRDRWEQVQGKLTGLGWEKPANSPLQEVDFARDLLLCVFRSGDEADRFSLHRFTERGGQATAEIVMSYIIYKSHVATPAKWNFILVALPQSPSVKVTVAAYHPMNGGPYPTPDKAQLEWAKTFTPSDGDVVDGLSGLIRAGKDTVKAGEDILVEFKLEFDASADLKPWHFALKLDAAYVWDGKYSNGYRNHAFLVETPDGQSLMLRRPEQLAWDKNAPHPVEIAAGKPYVLPEWVEGKGFKSLKALGLDTSKPGLYRITGIYLATAGEAKDWRTGGNVALWGGDLATNTLQVTVK